MPSQMLLVDCPDRTGLVYTITGVLFRHGYNIVVNHEFVDRATNHFFMRTEFAGEQPPDVLVQELRAALPPQATVRLADVGPRRLVIMASREHHCLAELLLRHAYGELNARVHAVVSNFDVLQPLAAQFGIPFHTISHVELSRATHESKLLEVIDGYEPEYIVLAKYMRVLSPAFVARYQHRIINIHHSFLPAFIGANPYRQAFERGVKIIGATAHFVTDELDEGPIIAQSVIPVDHSHTAAEMAQAGRDVEKLVLARALRLVCEERVFLNGRRTIIFD